MSNTTLEQRVAVENDWEALLAATPLVRGETVEIEGFKFTFYPVNMLDLVALIDQEPATKDLLFGAVKGNKSSVNKLRNGAFSLGADAMALIVATSARTPDKKDLIRNLPPHIQGPAIDAAMRVVAPRGMVDFFGQLLTTFLTAMGADLSEA